MLLLDSSPRDIGGTPAMLPAMDCYRAGSRKQTLFPLRCEILQRESLASFFITPFSPSASSLDHYASFLPLLFSGQWYDLALVFRSSSSTEGSLLFRQSKRWRRSGDGWCQTSSFRASIHLTWSSPRLRCSFAFAS